MTETDLVEKLAGINIISVNLENEEWNEDIKYLNQEYVKEIEKPRFFEDKKEALQEFRTYRNLRNQFKKLRKPNQDSYSEMENTIKELLLIKEHQFYIENEDYYEAHTIQLDNKTTLLKCKNLIEIEQSKGIPNIDDLISEYNTIRRDEKELTNLRTIRNHLSYHL